MTIRSQAPSPQQIALRERMIGSIREQAANMDALEILAVAAYTVGQLIALQDQRTITPAMAMEIVVRNIEAGNLHAVEQSLGNPKGAA